MKHRILNFRILIIAAVLITTLISCSKSKTPKGFPSEHEIVGVVRPLKLNPDTTEIFIQDYVIDTALFDSVSFSEGITALPESVPNEKIVITYENNALPYYSHMTLWVAGFPYIVLLEKSDKIAYEFTFKPQASTYQKVSIAGDFNDWNPANTSLRLKDGVWHTRLMLDPGVYQYLVVPDGIWMRDYNNADSASNNMGGFNSVLNINTASNEPLPLIYPDKVSGDTLVIGTLHKVARFHVLWENILLQDDYVFWAEDFLKIVVPTEAKALDKSFIRVYTENAAGKSNDLMIPLASGKPLLNASELTRSHKEAQIYYFMLTDRFFNGNTDNDEPIRDAEVAPAANFMGGDLIGITKKLKEGYFDSLPVTTIWLSPVVQNPLKAYKEYPEPHRKFSGYHGYWPINSTLIDHRFGSAECLRELVAEAHARHINVILDFVANHVHEDNPLIKNNPQWATNVDLPDGKNIRRWDEHRLTTWFDTFLPSLDFTQQEVIDTMTAIGLYWINTYNLDGFRHDATKHIPYEFWRAMTLRLKREIVKPQGKTILQIGETFGSRTLIGSYVGSGLLDGQFDFNLYFDARSVFAQDAEPLSKAARALDQSFKAYGSNSLMGNITGNHDLPRFTSLASGDLSFSENAKEAAWKRKITITDTSGYSRMAQFTAFNMTIPGIPVIYYGDEIGMPGADDPDNRRMMKFDGLTTHEKNLRSKVQALANLKRQALPLNYGHFEWLAKDDKVLAYARKYFNQNLIVVISKNSESSSIKLPLPQHLNDNSYKALFGSRYEYTEGMLTAHLNPLGFEIFVNFDVKL